MGITQLQRGSCGNEVVGHQGEGDGFNPNVEC